MNTIKIHNINLVLDSPKTILTADTASGVTALTVKNITGFDTNQLLILGELGNQGSEIVRTHATTDPTGSTITLAAATTFPHSASTPVAIIRFNQLEISTATTTTGTKTVLNTVSIWANNDTTNYDDSSGATGYYFGRFYNSITAAFSDYTDPIPVSGFGLFCARTIIDTALGEINKSTSEVLSDSFAFQQIDNCQTECLRELKRWSFMQKFNQIIGEVSTGSWKVAMPTDLDDENTNKSIYQLRIGTQQRMIWVDKEKFDEFFIGVAYTTLASTLAVGASSMVLTDSSDFDSTGTVTIGAYTYEYTANNTSTGTLTLSEVVPSGENQASGADVFQGASSGLPLYWTIYGGYVYYTPNTASTYNGLNIYMDYYTKQSKITTDSTEIVLPDPTVVINYLCWKFLKKLNNGEETQGSMSYMNNYLTRREKMKQKEVVGKTFKMRPRVQNFNIQSQFNEDTPRWIRDAKFPNTGF